MWLEFLSFSSLPMEHGSPWQICFPEPVSALEARSWFQRMGMVLVPALMLLLALVLVLLMVLMMIPVLLLVMVMVLIDGRLHFHCKKKSQIQGALGGV
jgi:hypothetical protein